MRSAFWPEQTTGPVNSAAIMPCPPDSANDFDQLQFHGGLAGLHLAPVYSAAKLGHFRRRE
jgi:hypothetical protein